MERRGPPPLPQRQQQPQRGQQEQQSLHRHVIAGVGYLAAAFLFFGNDGNFEKARGLVGAAHVPPWLLALLPTSAAGWGTVFALGLGAVHQLVRARRAADADDARASARLDGMERRVVRGAEEDAIAAAAATDGSACNDLSCFRCRPSAHAVALARHSARLLELVRADADPALRGVSDEVLALAAAHARGAIASPSTSKITPPASSTMGKMHMKTTTTTTAGATASRPYQTVLPSPLCVGSSPGQNPTVFCLHSLSAAAPLHRRGGIGCGGVTATSYRCSKGKLNDADKDVDDVDGDDDDDNDDGDDEDARANELVKEKKHARRLYTAGKQSEKEENGGRRRGRGRGLCWCADLWKEGAGDIWKLERACEALAEELDAACARETRALEEDGGNGDGGGEGDGGGGTRHFASFDPAVIGPSGEWSAVYLWRNGVRDDDSCDAFPAAAAAVDALAQAAYLGSKSGGGSSSGSGRESGSVVVVGGGGSEARRTRGCAFGSAYLSRLAPGTTLKPHCGPCNARLRCHLALRLPAGAPEVDRGASTDTSPSGRNAPCELWVGGQRATWTEGEALLFDDSFEHWAVYHDTAPTPKMPPTTSGEYAASRVVLVVDFWHPELSESDRAALSVLYPPGM